MGRTVSELISSKIGNTITNQQTWGGILKNVASYGAVGDGSTDDTEKVQATIDAAIADGGKCVFFPHGATGIYKVTALTGLSSVVLLGDNASFNGISDVIHQLGEVGDDEIVTAMIEDGAVTAAKLAANIVIDSLLSGYVSGAGIVAATDSILQAIQKLNGNQVSHAAENAIDAHGTMPFCRVTSNANQSIANDATLSSVTALAFATEDADTDDMHDTVTNNSRITAKTAGVYLVTGNVRWASVGSGCAAHYIRKNGTDIMSRSKVVHNDANGANAIVTGTIYLNINDYVELVVVQNSGGSLDVISSGTSFSMVKVG